MTLYVVPIIEGHTEASCVGTLLQRLGKEVLSRSLNLQVLPSSRGDRDRLIHSDGTHLTNKIEEAYAKLAQRLRREPSSRGLLLLMIDAEKDCPKVLAPQLLQRGRKARSDADIACVLAKRMLENWFVAAASSLAGVHGLPTALQTPNDPEERSGTKWLIEQIRSVDRRRTYKKTVDAKAFAAAMDLRQCRANSPSFDKLCRELEQRAAPISVEQETDDPSKPMGE